MHQKLNIAMILPPSVAYSELVDCFDHGKGIGEAYPLSMPLGALHLLSCIEPLEETKFIGVLDYSLEYHENKKHKSVDEYIDGIVNDLDFVPDVLGFTLIFSTTHKFFDLCANKLKSKWPNVKIVVGGTHATNCPKEIFENKNVDFLVRGEAEIAFPLLLQAISKGADPEGISIKGVYTRKRYFDNAFLLEIGDYAELDLLPLPGWKFLDMEKYATLGGRGSRGKNRGDKYEPRVATFMSNRGCPYKCTFCSSHTVHGRKMRYFSIEKTVEMIQHLNEEYGINTFVVEDDLFTVQRERTILLCKALRSLGIPDFEMQVPNALSINTLTEEVVDELCKTGMEVVNLAIESGSQYVQTHIIEKNVNLEKAKEIVKFFKKRNVITRCFFILGSPNETKEHIEETIAYARDLGADWCTFNPVIPLVGTKGYQQFLDMGYIVDDPIFWSESAFGKRLFDTKEISGKELMDVSYRANLEVNFIENANLKEKSYQKALESISDIVNDYPFHIVGLYSMALCYEGLGQINKVNDIRNEIGLQLKTDERAISMMSEYGSLMPDFDVFMES
jgi:anaerobic magnesium-protoporphyrin IX monomethyl ester cyclase